MELNREQIIKALECCIIQHTECRKCPLLYTACESGACYKQAKIDALSLINELTEENERLRDLCDEVAMYNEGFEKDNALLRQDLKTVKADTVRKMQEMLKPIFVDKSYTLYTGACVHHTIDQITKEMLEDTE